MTDVELDQVDNAYALEGRLQASIVQPQDVYNTFRDGTNPIHTCNQVLLWEQNLVTKDLDVLSYLDTRNTIDATIASNMSCNVYTQAAALESSPLKAHVFDLYLKDYDPVLHNHLSQNLKEGIVIPSTKTIFFL